MWLDVESRRAPNKRIEPMRGSVVNSVLYWHPCGALPLMAHPHRWATKSGA